MTSRTWTVRTAADIGRTVAELRGLRGLTQQDLARESGLSRSRIAKLEVGASSILLEQLLRLLRRQGATLTIEVEDPDGAP